MDAAHCGMTLLAGYQGKEQFRIAKSQVYILHICCNKCFSEILPKSCRKLLSATLRERFDCRAPWPRKTNMLSGLQAHLSHPANLPILSQLAVEKKSLLRLLQMVLPLLEACADLRYSPYWTNLAHFGKTSIVSFSGELMLHPDLMLIVRIRKHGIDRWNNLRNSPFR